MKYAALMLAYCLGLWTPSFAMDGRPDSDMGEGSTVEIFRANDLAMLRAQLQSRLLQAFRDEGTEVRAELIGEWGLTTAMLPDVAVRMHRRSATKGRWQIDMAVCSAVEGHCRAGSPAMIRYQARALTSVWVVTGGWKKGDALACDGLRRDWRDVQSIGTSGDWGDSCEALSAWRARRPLQPGDVLKKTDLMPREGVMERETARVIAHFGGIDIQTKGMVLSDARVGQQVPVRLNGQATVVQCVVISPGVVRVMEGM